jgi:hypothetical protein
MRWLRRHWVVVLVALAALVAHFGVPAVQFAFTTDEARDHWVRRVQVEVIP